MALSGLRSPEKKPFHVDPGVQPTRKERLFLPLEISGFTALTQLKNCW
jgi:hypothetical protein